MALQPDSPPNFFSEKLLLSFWCLFFRKQSPFQLPNHPAPVTLGVFPHQKLQTTISSILPAPCFWQDQFT